MVAYLPVFTMLMSKALRYSTIVSWHQLNSRSMASVAWEDLRCAKVLPLKFMPQDVLQDCFSEKSWSDPIKFPPSCVIHFIYAYTLAIDENSEDCNRRWTAQPCRWTLWTCGNQCVSSLKRKYEIAIWCIRWGRHRGSGMFRLRGYWGPPCTTLIAMLWVSERLDFLAVMTSPEDALDQSILIHSKSW